MTREKLGDFSRKEVGKCSILFNSPLFLPTFLKVDIIV